MKISKLEIGWRKCDIASIEGAFWYSSRNGQSREAWLGHECEEIPALIMPDFIIDRVPLSETLSVPLPHAGRTGNVSVLSLCNQKKIDEIINHLMLKVDLKNDEHNDFPSIYCGDKRWRLYVCNQCSSAACGICTVEIVEENNKIIWKSFAWGDDANGINLDTYEHVGFIFDKNEYLGAFANYKKSLKDLHKERCIINKQIKRLIKEKPPLEQGLKIMKESISIICPEFDTQKLNFDIDKAYEQFNSQLNELINDSSFQEKKIPLNFCIFEAIAGLRVSITRDKKSRHITDANRRVLGSDGLKDLIERGMNPGDVDVGWVLASDDLRGRIIKFEVFNELLKILKEIHEFKNYLILRLYLSLSTLIILLTNYMKNNKTNLLKRENKFSWLFSKRYITICFYDKFFYSDIYKM